MVRLRPCFIKLRARDSTTKVGDGFGVKRRRDLEISVTN
ncbi:hypothetical protein COLO4_37522 [Corchorus olitorius]|uniref:Uncharacterized protein n=1 Tax=Corchorus olitorius TaxID=93759 RepID=A0A1R3G169_9ROSI|nr:hypothetical protein COLO4_37522 [Corchorus olitorius]